MNQPHRAGGAAVVGLLLCASPAAAQLRPLPTVDWHQQHSSAACGLAYYRDIEAGLVGARGRLSSLGDCSLELDLGLAKVHVAGTVFRSFTEDSTYAWPVRGVDPKGGPVRRDWGDFVLETVIPVRLGDGPWVAGFRFGARFPTTDNQVGLERDRTDVHMVAMGGWQSARLGVYGELGVGINGTRVNWREQQDVLVYAAHVGYALAPRLRAQLAVLGHYQDRTERGNPNLGEIHAGVRWGARSWVAADAIAGFTEASPTWGLRVRLGRTFGLK